MSTPGANFWAKKSVYNGRYMWLPLNIHLSDTKIVSGLLWEHWLSDHQRRFIADSLIGEFEDRKSVAKQLAEFLGATHDLGKAVPAFYRKPGWLLDVEFEKQLSEKLIRAGFMDSQRQEMTQESSKTPHQLASQTLLEMYGLNSDIGTIIGGHHGKPFDSKKQIKKNIKNFPYNYYLYEGKGDRFAQRWKNEQERLIAWALETTGFESLDEVPGIEQPAQVLLSGLLIMADWISSNEDYFPLIDFTDSGEGINSLERAFRGWDDWKNTDVISFEREVEVEQLFEKRFNFNTPRNVQKTFVDIIRKSENHGLYILEAPMGIGKTEAALAGIEELIRIKGMGGMFFGLPTQATSNGIFPRIESWLQVMLKDSNNYNEKTSIQLIHGKASLNDKFQKLKTTSNIYSDDEEVVTVNSWFSGKKTAILDDFVVGTVDQFLLLSLKKKHLALRHLAFSKKVVVIDEVHANDAYMNVYMKNALEWMGAYQIPVILLSATLPAKTRQQLIQHYISGQGFSLNETIKAENWDTSDAYPLITYTDGNRVNQETFDKDEVTNSVEIIQLADEDFEDKIAELVSNGGIVGIIVNTVRKAQELGEKLMHLYGQETVEILHSSFISTDRIQKEEKLLNIIGKGKERPQKKIIIGTQVIEVSLDIDFDVLISDLAPMDLLMQRIGRLHRHENVVRPKEHTIPRVYVLGTNENFNFDTGSQAVYGQYLLIRTQYFLPEIVRLPYDISKLVQEVYGKDDLDLPDILYSSYKEAKCKQDVLLNKKEGKANAYRLNEPETGHGFHDHENLIGWLENVRPQDSDPNSTAQVRDGDETIEVIPVKKIENGYSMIGETEDISNRISESEIARNLAKQTLKIPAALTKRYNIQDTIEYLENTNNHLFPEWQQQPWLKGSLGLIFDSNGKCIINGLELHYSEYLGLKYTKEVSDGEV